MSDSLRVKFHRDFDGPAERVSAFRQLAYEYILGVEIPRYLFVLEVTQDKHGFLEPLSVSGSVNHSGAKP